MIIKTSHLIPPEALSQYLHLGPLLFKPDS